MSSRTTEGREAITKWKKIKQYPHFAHLALFPHSGRTHQIRVHLSEMGHPIVGDRLYGTRTIQGKRHKLSQEIQEVLLTVEHPFLHARQLTLTHPLSQELMTFKAPLPDIYEKFLTLIRDFDKE